MNSRYTAQDRNYVRYCIRYAVKVLGKDGVSRYLDLLDETGAETEPPAPPLMGGDQRAIQHGRALVLQNETDVSPIPPYRELSDSEEAAEAATWD